jgi:ABC-type transport system involved in multi-copper enzyme maturation permease subunit
MKALLRADWLRFRRRRDFWIIAIAVLVIGGVGYLSSYRSEVTDPQYPDAAAVRQEVISFSDFTGSGMTQAEIDAQIDQMVAEQVAQYDQARADWEAHKAIALQKYDVAQSPFTLLGSGVAPLLALVLTASLAVGDEFRFGTIRTSLLAAGSRRRFLGARLISLFVMTVGLLGALVLLGTIFGLGLRLVGAEVSASTTPIDPASGLAWFGGHVLTTMTVISLGLALTVLLRSGAMPLLLILLGGLIELFIANLPIFAPNEFLSGVPQAFLGASIRTLTTRLGLDTHAVALEGEVPFAAIELPLITIAAIIAAWGLLFLLLADRRFRTMDVVE